MKNIKISSLVIISLLFLTSCKTLKSFVDHDSDKSEVVSKYKGGEVTLKEAQTELDRFIAKNEQLKGLTFSELEQDQKETIIKEVIIRRIIYKEAKKQKINKEKDFKKAVKLFKIELLKQKLFVKLIDDAKKEENLKKYYDDLVEKMKDKQDIRVRYIAVKTEKEANSIHRILLKYPTAFASQAKSKSLDKEIAKKGGDLGFVLEDILPVEVSAKAKVMKKHEISKPIALGNKWIIIKLEDIRPAKIEKFEDVKDNLAEKLSEKALRDFISNSLKDAEIDFIKQK